MRQYAAILAVAAVVAVLLTVFGAPSPRAGPAEQPRVDVAVSGITSPEASSVRPVPHTAAQRQRLAAAVESGVSTNEQRWPSRVPMDRSHWPAASTVASAVRLLSLPRRAADKAVVSLHLPVVEGQPCHGAVVVQLTRCVNITKRVSHDAAFDGYVRGTAGPIALYVLVYDDDGAQAAGAAFFDAERCQYVAEFDVAPGVAGGRVKVVQELAAFAALDETITTVPPGRKVELANFAASCTTGSYHRAPARLCDGRDVDGAAGHWETAQTSPPARNLTYFPWAGHRRRHAVSPSCDVEAFSRQPQRFQRCMARRAGAAGARRYSVLFTGDSQVRTLFRQWESVATNRVAVLQKGGNLTVAARDGSWRAVYIWDPYLDGFLDRGALVRAEFDAVVLGIGAWPASFGQWTVGQFTARVAAVAAVAAVAGPLVAQRGVRVVWMGSPAWPKPRQMTGFRITNYRLGVFNAVGARAVVAAGGAHLDLFGLSLPQRKLHRGDGMHYDRGAVLYAALDVLLTLLCRPSSL
jgi:hypothetical protein